MEKISEHLLYNEAIKSITARRLGIANNPSSELILNMRFIADTVFEPLREALGNKPIGIASFYRSEKLNTAIGGSRNSQHCRGQAIDIDGDIIGYHTNKEIFDWIYNNVAFDQLIWEYGTDEEPDWVHVSKIMNENRKEALVAYRKEGNTAYKYYKG